MQPACSSVHKSGDILAGEAGGGELPNKKETDSDIDHKLVVTHKEEVERQCRDWGGGDTNHGL